MSREDLHHDQQVLDTLEKYVMDLKKENVQDGQSAFSLLRGWFNAEKEEYDNGFDKAAKQLEYAFDFMESAFAGGQELVVFITELIQAVLQWLFFRNIPVKDITATIRNFYSGKTPEIFWNGSGSLGKEAE